MPIGYTLLKQGKQAEKCPNRVGFSILACATEKGTLLGERGVYEDRICAGQYCRAEYGPSGGDDGAAGSRSGVYR